MVHRLKDENKISLSHRRMRKAANEGFSKGSVKRFYERQMTEAILLACDYLVKPSQWEQHLGRTAASMILSVVYGYPAITSEQDRNADLINDFAGRLSRAAYPGAHLVEFFTWMRHIPSR
jgi:N-acetyl-gamma-glutamylphosphate reductase